LVFPRDDPWIFITDPVLPLSGDTLFMNGAWAESVAAPARHNKETTGQGRTRANRIPGILRTKDFIPIPNRPQW
jgi:hypothetical protein